MFSLNDLAEIYKEFGMNLAESQQRNFFPYAIRGEKTLTPGGDGNL